MRRALPLFLAFFVFACEDDFPEPYSGGTISGTVTYDGTYADELTTPALLVAAFATMPPEGSAHGMIIIENPDLAAGTGYRIENLPPFDDEERGYYIVAQLTEAEALGQEESPTGSYPNFCALTSYQTGNVSVVEDATTEGVNIVLWDSAGFADPCMAPGEDPCPTEGNATLIFDIDMPSAVDSVGEDDILALAFFDTVLPEGFPVRFQLLEAEDIAFPLTIVDNGVPPDSYLITICYDRDGDNIASQTCDGPGDGSGAYPEAPQTEEDLLEHAAGTIVRAGMNLDTGELYPAAVLDPADFGCE